MLKDIKKGDHLALTTK